MRLRQVHVGLVDRLRARDLRRTYRVRQRAVVVQDRADQRRNDAALRGSANRETGVSAVLQRLKRAVAPGPRPARHEVTEQRSQCRFQAPVRRNAGKRIDRGGLFARVGVHPRPHVLLAGIVDGGAPRPRPGAGSAGSQEFLDEHPLYRRAHNAALDLALDKKDVFQVDGGERTALAGRHEPAVGVVTRVGEVVQRDAHRTVRRRLRAQHVAHVGRAVGHEHDERRHLRNARLDDAIQQRLLLGCRRRRRLELRFGTNSVVAVPLFDLRCVQTLLRAQLHVHDLPQLVLLAELF